MTSCDVDLKRYLPWCYKTSSHLVRQVCHIGAKIRISPTHPLEPLRLGTETLALRMEAVTLNMETRSADLAACGGQFRAVRVWVKAWVAVESRRSRREMQAPGGGRGIELAGASGSAGARRGGLDPILASAPRVAGSPSLAFHPRLRSDAGCAGSRPLAPTLLPLAGTAIASAESVFGGRSSPAGTQSHTRAVPCARYAREMIRWAARQ